MADFVTTYSASMKCTQTKLEVNKIKRSLGESLKTELWFDVIEILPDDKGSIVTIDFSGATMRKVAPGCDRETKLTFLAQAIRKAIPGCEVNVTETTKRIWKADSTII